MALPRYARTLNIGLKTDDTGDRRLKIVGQGDLASTAAWFHQPDGFSIHPSILGVGSNYRRTGITYTVDLLLHDPQLGVILHELMHWLHFTSHPRSYVDLHDSALRTPYKLIAAAGGVSTYSTTDPHEFVAEYGVGRLLGRRYDSDTQRILDDLYERLGGPSPEQLRPVHAPELTRDELASLRRRVRKLTGMRHLTDEDIKARERVLSRFDRFRTLGHRARLISTELTAGAGGSGSVTGAADGAEMVVQEQDSRAVSRADAAGTGTPRAGADPPT